MLKASAAVVLPTSIIGSLPRPAWYDAVLGASSFLEAMMNARYREQYEDAVSVHLRDQETAGLDICTDGDAHFDDQVGGMSWQSYPLTHMAGLSVQGQPSVYNVAAAAHRTRIAPRAFERQACGQAAFDFLVGLLRELADVGVAERDVHEITRRAGV